MSGRKGVTNRQTGALRWFMATLAGSVLVFAPVDNGRALEVPLHIVVIVSISLCLLLSFLSDMVDGTIWVQTRPAAPSVNGQKSTVLPMQSARKTILPNLRQSSGVLVWKNNVVKLVRSQRKLDKPQHFAKSGLARRLEETTWRE